VRRPFGSSPSVPSPFGELKAGVVRTILARRVTLGVFSAVALVILLVSRISYLNPLFYAPLVWFLLTFPFKYLIGRQRTNRALHAVHTGFFIAEIALITVLVHLMGGSEWIGNIFYLFTVIYANVFLPRRHGYLVTGIVIAFYAGLVLLEYSGFLPHRSLFAVLGEPYRSLSYNLATILAGTVGVYAVAAFTVRTFTDIYARKNRMLAARERQLSEMSRHLLGAQDEERRRIARELHDDLIQSLAAVKLHLGPVRDRIGDEAHHELFEIVDQAIAQTRTLAYSIRPPLLDDLGLIPSLRRLADTVEADNDVAVRIDSDVDARLNVSVESLLFYVAHEALQNVVKHADARTVTIEVRHEPPLVRLTVTDDGVGFRPQDPRGLGLQGIRERVEVSGGTCTLSTAPGRGTCVSVEIPCDVDSPVDR
jgi:signal transduction histidine kinase